MFIAMECKEREHNECMTIPCDCPCHKIKPFYEEKILN